MLHFLIRDMFSILDLGMFSFILDPGMFFPFKVLLRSINALKQSMTPRARRGVCVCVCVCV